MVDNECFFSQVQAPIESETVDVSKVKLNYTWVFWENYEGKVEKHLDYTKSVKDLFKFSDIITFWQFWNNYPGSSPANIFYNGERLK
jgi:hypothetical protein